MEILQNRVITFKMGASWKKIPNYEINIILNTIDLSIVKCQGNLDRVNFDSHNMMAADNKIGVH